MYPDEWTTGDGADMRADGWTFNYIDDYRGAPVILAMCEARRVDDDPIRFATDDEARAFVQLRATEGAGAPHAIKALRIVVAGEVPTPIPPAVAPV